MRRRSTAWLLTLRQTAAALLRRAGGCASRQHGTPRIDLSTLKASLGLLGEMSFDELLVKLLRVVMEHAQADKAYVLLYAGAGLSIEAQALRETGAVKTVLLPSLPVAGSPLLPAAIVDCVVGTGRKVLLRNACTAPEFSADDYIVRNRPAGLLCLPISRIGQLSGMLYLEKGPAGTAFDPAAVEVLELLAAQAAISLENARLYRKLQQEDGERRLAQQALIKSEERFRNLTQLSSDWYWEQDENFRFTLLSGGIFENGMADAAHFLGKTRWEMPIRYDETMWADYRARLAAHEPFEDVEYQVLGKDGKPQWNSFSGMPLFDADGRFIGYRGTGKVITARKLAEQALKDSEERFRSLSKLSSDWYWEQDEQFRFTTLSGGIYEKGGTRPESLIGKTRWELPIELDPALLAAHKATQEAHLPFYDLEYRTRGDDRRSYWYSISGEPLFDARGVFKGYRGIGKNITERKQAEERIHHMAHHDALTGLPNRTLLLERLTQAIAEARHDRHLVALLFIDLDHFKHVNDSLGHSIGDGLLQMAAERLKLCLRKSDSIARLGGDEFVISLPALKHGDEAAAVADKVLDALQPLFLVDGHELHAAASIGISLYPQDGENADALMRAADTAMYHAKEKGRDRYEFFTPNLTAAAQRRLELANLLRNALARDEFSLHFQPQIDMETGKILGAEALLRWWRSECGFISPAEFIPIAEDTGLIVPIGEWALREACAQLKRWHDAGHSQLGIAVNLSARQVLHPGLVQSVADILDASGMPAGLLDLEITESILMHPSDENLVPLSRLNEMGVQLSVDDFGTGYSSLSYLKRFPLDALKIDQSFVRGIGTDQNDVAIINAIIAMAQSLNLRVIAEGVETASQAAFLVQHGCLTAQGYHFGRPLPADDFGQLLEKRSLAGLKAVANR